MTTERAALPVDDAGEAIKSTAFSAAIAAADGLVIVAPEYNHSFPGLLKHALDSCLSEYIHKAVGLVGVSAGPFAGIRVIQSLLPVMRELGLVTLFLLSVVVFAISNVLPGNVGRAVLGGFATQESVDALNEQLGTNRPILVQFAEYIWRVAHGDLGRSIISNKMVIEEIASTMGPTLELMIAGMLFAIPIGMALGTIAAVKRGTWLDRSITRR